MSFMCVQLAQTFSRCVLSCEEVGDLDELLATRLLSFLMDHHQEVLQVPVYLRNAVEDHINYLKSLVSPDKNETSLNLLKGILHFFWK